MKRSMLLKKFVNVAPSITKYILSFEQSLKKMRLNQIYFHTRRIPQKENKVPFKELYPLKLQNTVSRSPRKDMDNKCLFEMMLLFSCWKKTEFDNSKCSDVIQNLEKCWDRLQITMKEEKASNRRDVPTPGSKNLTDKQLNYILRQYPNV